MFNDATFVKLEPDMQQVKIFSGLEGATEEMSSEINTWIRESGAKIVQITGNIAPQSNATAGSTGTLGVGSARAPSDVMIFVLYEEG